MLEKLPAAWANDSAPWLTLQLKNEEAMVSMEKELAIFIEAEKANTVRALEQTKTMKTIATAIGFLVAFGILAGAAYIWLTGHSTNWQP